MSQLIGALNGNVWRATGTRNVIVAEDGHQLAIVTPNDDLPARQLEDFKPYDIWTDPESGRSGPISQLDKNQSAALFIVRSIGV